MRTAFKIIAATLLLVPTAALAGCDDLSKSRSAGGDNTPKDCFSVTGSNKAVYVDLTWRGDDPPWEAQATAVDVVTNHSVNIHEIVTIEDNFTRKLQYVSGCRVHIAMSMKNHKRGYALVRADDGKGGALALPQKGCVEQSNDALTISCEFTTSR